MPQDRATGGRQVGQKVLIGPGGIPRDSPAGRDDWQEFPG